MRSRSTFRQLVRTTAATALLLTVVALAPVAGASDAPTTTTTTTTTPDELLLQCESGVVTSPDGTETSSATLERVPTGPEAGPGCRFLEQ